MIIIKLNCLREIEVNNIHGRVEKNVFVEKSCSTSFNYGFSVIGATKYSTKSGHNTFRKYFDGVVFVKIY